MEKILALRADISAKVDEMRTLAESDKPEDITKYDELRVEVEKLNEKEERLMKVEGLTPKDFAPVSVDEIDPAQPEADSKEWRGGFGEFLGAVMKAGRGYEVDPRLVEARQLGLNEGVPSEGGFLVQTDHVTDLIKRSYETGVLASRVRKFPVSANSNGMTMNAVAENSRETGSRWGGVQAYWLHEAGTKTRSRPEFRQMEWKLKKLIGLCYATDELLQDTTALSSVITEAFTEEFSWMLDDAIFRGTGVGQPLGITGHASTLAVTAEAGQAANTILFENIVNMWARMWGRSRGNAIWTINQDIEPQLMTMSLAVGVGGVPVYLPAGGASGSPYGQLLGRPVVPIEHASTLGIVGDISLLDLSQYLSIDKGGVQTASSIHVAFTTDESAFRFVYRTDGQPLWNAPLTPANSTNTLSPFVQLETRP